MAASPLNLVTVVDNDKHEQSLETIPDKISAYYSLVFPGFTYYLQTLTVTIGRRCIPASAASTSSLPQVDVDLGALKSVSRLHAKIEYDEEEERFVLVVVGRNGAWVDGVWSPSGSRVPLGERSQIQIASRTFHFVLPPPPAPEDSPSPSSQSSTNRNRSPSVDITSLSPPSSLPSCSPPPIAEPPPLLKNPPSQPPEPLPTEGTARPKIASKKRKKADVDAIPRPKPEDMPPKPQLTYAQLCYRAIKALGGKATLQDICTWAMDNYEWYRFNEGSGWESSIRHNLSSNRGFKKMEKRGGERGKGFFWCIEEKYENVFEERDSGQGGASAASGGKDGRSAKSKNKGGPLPPPLTSTPLAFKTAVAPVPKPAPSSIQTASTPTPQITIIPVQGAVSMSPATSFTASAASPVPALTAVPPLPSSVRIPIIVGPVPPSHTASTNPSSSTLSPPSSSSASLHLPSQPIVLHNNTLILNPTIFSHLMPEQLKELENLGAQKALEILQGYIVRFLKERIRGEGTRGRGRGRGMGRRGRGRGGQDDSGSARGIGTSVARTEAKVETETGSATSGPFTNLPHLPPNGHAEHNVATKHSSSDLQQTALASVLSTGVSVDTKPCPADPVAMLGVRANSPVIIVDDDDTGSEGPVMKKRRLQGTNPDSVLDMEV